MNTHFPPSPFSKKGVTEVRGLRPLGFVGLSSPWGGPAETTV